MTRRERNKNYHIDSQQSLPTTLLVRDFCLTLLAWGIAFYFAKDFLLQLTFGVLHELDTNPLNDLDWELFAKQLKVSLLFSGTVLLFLLFWAMSNLLLLMRTKDLAGKQTIPLKLEREVESFDCSSEEVAKWREEKIVTVSIDNSGNILDVVSQASSQNTH